MAPDFAVVPVALLRRVSQHLNELLIADAAPLHQVRLTPNQRSHAEADADALSDVWPNDEVHEGPAGFLRGFLEALPDEQLEQLERGAIYAVADLGQSLRDRPDATSHADISSAVEFVQLVHAARADREPKL